MPIAYSVYSYVFLAIDVYVCFVTSHRILKFALKFLQAFLNCPSPCPWTILPPTFASSSMSIPAWWPRLLSIVYKDIMVLLLVLWSKASAILLKQFCTSHRLFIPLSICTFCRTIFYLLWVFAKSILPKGLEPIAPPGYSLLLFISLYFYLFYSGSCPLYPPSVSRLPEDPVPLSADLQPPSDLRRVCLHQ